MANDKRLAALCEKAEGLGLDYVDTYYSIDVVTRKGQKIVFDKPVGDLGDSFFEPIESLLSVLAPGPVIRIDPKCYKCMLKSAYCGHSRYGESHPHPDHCPGPAPPGKQWRMVLLPVGEEE